MNSQDQGTEGAVGVALQDEGLGPPVAVPGYTAGSAVGLSVPHTAALPGKSLGTVQP